MSKILAQAGISLADVYDVKGSIVGVEQLLSQEVALFHEMGSTVFSERMGGGVLRFLSGTINQSTAFNILSGVGNFPEVVTRILGVEVFLASGNGGRMENCQLSVSAPNGGGTGTRRDFPIWKWDTTNDVEQGIQIVDNGSAAGNRELLVPVNPLPGIPSFQFGTLQPSVPVPEFAFRGISSAFGAGTVLATCLIYISNAQTVRPSSYGLPIPSW